MRLEGEVSRAQTAWSTCCRFMLSPISRRTELLGPKRPRIAVAVLYAPNARGCVVINVFPDRSTMSGTRACRRRIDAGRWPRRSSTR